MEICKHTIKQRPGQRDGDAALILIWHLLAYKKEPLQHKVIGSFPGLLY